MINYIFGNGFSISVNPNFNYSKLLKGFIKKFKTENKIDLPSIIESNPEVFFSQMIMSKKLRDPKFMTLLFVIQQKLKKYLIERITNAPEPLMTYKADGYVPDKSKMATTNYDLNVEKVFSVSFVDHLHGRIDNPQSIIFAAAEAKKLVNVDIKSFVGGLSGEVRIFGLKPGYDSYIWNALIRSSKIDKIVFTYYQKNKQEEKEAAEYASLNKKLICMSSKEFEDSFFS